MWDFDEFFVEQALEYIVELQVIWDIKRRFNKT